MGGTVPTAGDDTRSSAFAARHFAPVWFSGLIWHLTRWGVAFLGTYLINEMTGSPRLVQLPAPCSMPRCWSAACSAA